MKVFYLSSVWVVHAPDRDFVFRLKLVEREAAEHLAESVFPITYAKIAFVRAERLVRSAQYFRVSSAVEIGQDVGAMEPLRRPRVNFVQLEKVARGTHIPPVRSVLKIFNLYLIYFLYVFLYIFIYFSARTIFKTELSC